MIVSRFAPSPTGRLHLGHALSAIRAHDLARAGGGRFLLRIEDIDEGRCREAFVAGIEEDLAWLGLAWDGPIVRQSARLAPYAAALERLTAMELVYPCFCTRAEIAASASAPHGDGGPVYPGTCRGLSADERERRRAEPHCWRLDMAGALACILDFPLAPKKPPPRFVPSEARAASAASGAGPSTSIRTDGEGCGISPLCWHDATAGQVRADPLPQGDVILARKDAPTSYHLAVTVDDAAQGVTDVVRGADLFAATHVHRLLQALLGLPTPRYHHHVLLVGADGARLAKRRGSPSLADLRAGGADPRALAADLRAGRLPLGFGAVKA